jgi:hypothetical protein
VDSPSKKTAEDGITGPTWRITTVICKMLTICDPTPRNESLCTFEEKGKVKKIIFFSIHDVFCQNRPIAVPRYFFMTTALQTCYNIIADWHTFFLKQLLFLCSKGNFLQRTFITMGGCHHVLTITTLSNFNRF